MHVDQLLKWTRPFKAAALITGVWALLWGAVSPGLADNRPLPGHVPAIVAQLSSLGDLPPTNQLHLALGVPLRDPAGLDAFLAQVYDPAGPRYHQYLTPQQFADQFGPTPAAYQSVLDFARSNHLAITATHGNRLLLDVAGTAADVQSAFHVHLRVYRHPTETRNFFAPDTEPSVDRALPLADISGLSDYSRPHPHLVRQETTAASHATPRSGSGSGGTYGGNDFRAAYLPGVTLTGTGQSIGMVEFDGYYASDISAYESTFGLPAVPLQTVLLDGYDGTPTTGSSSGNPEVSLDIEMAIAIAPGLSNIVVFEAGPNGLQNDILNSMAANPQIHQLSCSWGWSGGPSTTTDNIFKAMSAQGQSFLNAAGDSDAFTTGASSVNGVDNPSVANAPSSSPYITVVGGTTLTTTGPGGSWSGETVWNWGLTKGSYTGGSGGISSYYGIPSWQAGVSMAANGGSSTFRNTPDVALTADNIFVDYGSGSSGTFGGTSCAAPLWAGLTALMNEQAQAGGRSTMGFLNPAIYALGSGSSYGSTFHDITTGNNTSSDSPNNFHAVTGYDLCTGWGTPIGSGLINALAGSPAALQIFSGAGFNATGALGGPFTGTNSTLILTNAGATSLAWNVGTSANWLSASPASGTLASAGTVSVTLSLAAAAANLAVGSYTAIATFTNTTSGQSQNVSSTLQIAEPLAILAGSGFTASGEVGGPFTVTSTTFTLTNSRNSSLPWSAVPTAAWLTASPASGTLTHGYTQPVIISLNAAAKALPGGLYTNSLKLTDAASGYAQNYSFVLQVGQNLVQNGGLETGSFTGWTLAGDTVVGTEIYDEVASTSPLSYPLAVHSGIYGAFLGDDRVATLSQTLTTQPGHSYYLSLWLDNPQSGSGQSFAVNWNTNTSVASPVYAISSPPAFTWTNLTFILNATANSTVLQFAAQNTPNYFGLDDVSVTPIPSPSIDAATLTNTSFSLTWYAVAGLNYEILTATNLLNATWTVLATKQATGSTLSFTNPAATDHQRYYRILRLP